MMSQPPPSVAFAQDVLFEQEMVDLGVQFERHPAIQLLKVHLKPETQVRRGGHQAPTGRIERYAVQMRDDAKFPAIVVARRADQPDEYDLVDGNTRVEAAKHKLVQRDVFPAYVLLNVSWAQCREIGVFQNQRNGEDLTKDEALDWVKEALERGLPLQRIARVSGFSYNRVKALNGIHEFDQKSKRLALPESVEKLPGGTKQMIADDLKMDSIFKETALLAAESGMPLAELKPIVQAMKGASSEQVALDQLAQERSQRQSAIDALADAIARGETNVRPPYAVQMLKHLNWLGERDPHDLIEHSPTTRDNALKLIEVAYERLGQTLSLYRQGQSSGQLSQAAD
jgi:hypothetical protein